jgi:predicted transcriptional regulator
MSFLEKAFSSGIAPFVTYDVSRVPKTFNIQDTVASVKSAPSGSVLVIDAGTQALSGIVTENDLAKLVGGNINSAEDLATKEVVAIRENAQLWQMLKIINGENILNRPLEYLPVVDAANKPVGVINRKGLQDRLAKFEQGMT